MRDRNRMMASATAKWNTTDGESASTGRRRDLTFTAAAASSRKGSSSTRILLLMLVVAVVIFCLWGIIGAEAAGEGIAPTPWPWPHQFHSILLMNYSGQLQIIDLWYDWTNGRNFNIMQYQLRKDLVYDLEWNNGTSFVYTFNSSSYCSTAQLDVGILRPNWLEGANYLGQRHVDGFLCNVWEKVDFIWYYEDVVTHRPVHWVFYTGRAAHVMTFEVGAVLEDSKWQAPAYCFEKLDYKTDLEADNTIKMSLEEHLTDRLLGGSLAY